VPTPSPPRLTVLTHGLTPRYGHLTWEWIAGLRSVIHPALFAAPLYLLKLARIDSTTTISVAASLLQSTAAAATDNYVYLLTSKLYGLETARCDSSPQCSPRHLQHDSHTLHQFSGTPEGRLPSGIPHAYHTAHPD
jgi:hypothetical protein